MQCSFKKNKNNNNKKKPNQTVRVLWLLELEELSVLIYSDTRVENRRTERNDHIRAAQSSKKILLYEVLR